LWTLFAARTAVLSLAVRVVAATIAADDTSKTTVYSMSSQIEVERKDYYLQLERTQRGDLDITSWLSWFSECLGRSIDNVSA